MTEIDGLDIHFIHVRSKHENALPLIVTHGWPGSVIEQLKIIDPLDQSHGAWRERVGRFPSGDTVAAGLRVFSQADHDRLGPRPHRTRLGRADEAPWIHAICVARRRFGRGRLHCDGQTGASGIAGHSHQLPWNHSTRHCEGASGRRPAALRSLSRRTRAYEQLTVLFAKRRAYAQMMGTRPQTLYGLADSPVGLGGLAL